MKKVISLLLVLVMAASLAACGSKDAGETKKETDTTKETAADESKNVDSESIDGTQALEEGTFIIGGIGPLTGVAASYGVSVKQGAEIAVKEINDAGGVVVDGTSYQLKLEFVDDEHSEDKAIQAYNTVMDRGAQVILGTVTSGPCIAISDLTYEDGILQITPSGSAVACIKNSNAFRICFTDPMQGETMADFAINELGYTKIAVIYCNSDEYSIGMKDAFEETVADLGGEIVISEAFGTDDVDFNTQLTKIKGTDAEVIFVPAYYGSATYITKQAKDMGMELPFIGGDGWDGILGTVTDTSTVEGAIFLSPFLATDTDPMIANFVSAYQAAYNAIPDQFAADGYDGIYTIKAALEEANSIESADLIAAMTKIKVDGLTGPGITFTEEGEPNKGAKFIQIKDGQYTAYEK